MKKMPKFIMELEIIDTFLGVLGVTMILSAAIIMQLVYNEMPCPLCLLQRAAFINIGIALLLNIRYGIKVSHWALVILSAFAGIAVSIRQILLHINDTTGYGSLIFGLHEYTWCFIGYSIALIGSAIMLVIYPEKKNNASVRGWYS